MTSKLSEYADAASAAFQAIEEAATTMDEISTLALSELYAAAREMSDDFETAYKEVTAPIQTQLREYQTAAKTPRASAKQVLETLKEGMDACYDLERQLIEETKEQAMITGDFALLEDLPEAPVLASGVSFAETKTAMVIDLDKIPEEFIVKTVDTKALTKALREGAVPGAVLKTERTWKRVTEKGEK
jgi:hypothetical protein